MTSPIRVCLNADLLGEVIASLRRVATTRGPEGLPASDESWRRVACEAANRLEAALVEVEPRLVLDFLHGEPGGPDIACVFPWGCRCPACLRDRPLLVRGGRA